MPRENGSLGTHQRALWTILVDNFPATIVKQLLSTVNVRSPELHSLYAILMEAQYHRPHALFTAIQSLPDNMARKMVVALEDTLHLKGCDGDLTPRAPIAAGKEPPPGETHINPFEPEGSIPLNIPATAAQVIELTEMPLRTQSGCKPLFWDAKREMLWLSVLKLYETGCLRENGDFVSAPEHIVDFRTLHIVFRLNVEERRTIDEEGTSLLDPNHSWYHETADDFVEQWVRRLRTFVKDRDQEKEDA
ncbi:hypothetical protein BD289DRAFT_450453 [Coniella lustricola]|uniref:Uncharacterized protein n=1 Tax=Coniella lustricola TaxID=2025994 RepID=A0A2T3AIK0_9PEZI|nr:hypothetical protein BD289DRAFT_450453 [Coniella lustricola]